MSERHGMSNCQPAVKASRTALADVHVEQLGGNLHLRYGRPQVDAAVLIGTFLIAWMAIGAVVFGWLVVHADLSVLIAVAFIGPMVVVLVLAMLRALYSEEHLRLGPQGLSYEWRVRRVLRSRHFRLEEVNGAESGRVTT